MSVSIQPQKLPILMYHSVSYTQNRKFLPFVVSPEEFVEQMEYLYQHDYVPMTVTQLILARLGNEIGLPARPVVVTFDDGFADFLTNALPVLQRYKFVATLYVTTAYIGGTSRWLWREGEAARPMLTWDQVKYIHQSGIECGGHTLHHPQLDMLTIEEAHDEVVGCKSALEKHLQEEVSSFAYPFGYYTSEVKRLVHEAGYVSACAVMHAMSLEQTDPLALTRLMVKPGMTKNRFEQLLTGIGVSRVETLYMRTRTPVWRLYRRGSSFVTKQLQERK
jgi:peptidoglycan/xylan/chitin deacetylase (PgdA/CDA1 family)